MTQTAPATDARPADRLFVALQLILPTRFLSWLMHKLTRIEHVGFKNAFIRTFIRLYKIDMRQAEFEQPESYEHFNAFFTRALKLGTRPFDPDPKALLSPVDGTISQIGDIREGRIFQAKGHDYTVQTLLGGDAALARPFLGGRFATIYLAPNNYHRIHMPIAGKLTEWIYVPGRLFSVNPATARALPGVFARNERLVALFDTPAGPMAMVLVGALFVGSMETVWSGMVTPPHKRSGVERYQPIHPVQLARGAEMGRFNMGSTVILLSAPGAIAWNAALDATSPLRMGQNLGRIAP